MKKLLVLTVLITALFGCGEKKNLDDRYFEPTRFVITEFQSVRYDSRLSWYFADRINYLYPNSIAFIDSAGKYKVSDTLKLKPL